MAKHIRSIEDRALNPDQKIERLKIQLQNSSHHANTLQAQIYDQHTRHVSPATAEEG